MRGKAELTHVDEDEVLNRNLVRLKLELQSLGEIF